MKSILLFAALSILLSGCASNTTLSGRYLSNLDPNIDIAKSASILVRSNKEGDSLTNRRYIPDVIQALTQLGFTNVAAQMTAPDYILVVNFTSKQENLQQTVPVFTRHRGTPYVICHQNKNNNRVCTTHYHYNAPIVSGYRSITTSTNLHTFEFTLYDQQDTPILEVTSNVVDEDCSQWKIYKFLAADAIARINFSTPVDTQYSVTMPEDYSCQQ
ncbi:hypothetical protein [Marinomonas pollencensis]|uniref:Lipoprotein n=1 Tax=Marinomonas pollencensis TaxID=491954 RepID=A0A3E0DQC8_9GAMM|nr:hypothetical protein [Marinomonas pollencensis]REG85120.1 hypothetical protein DFP81_103320 [Marinomonas pollencensis]